MLQTQGALARDNRHAGLSASENHWRVFLMWIAHLAIVTLLAACGGGGGGASAGPGTPPAVPATPAGMTVSAGDGETTISWSAVAGATSYNIYRSTTQGVLGAKVGASATTSFVDTTAVNGVTYYYQVTADNAAGESPASAQSPGVTPAAPVAAPQAPAGVGAVAGNAQVTLNWTAVAGVGSYNVYRSTSAGTQGTKIATTSTPSYSDDGVVNGTTYYYQVTAQNAAGEGPASAQSSGVTPAVPVTVPAPPTGVNASAGNAQVSVSWNGVAGATSYNVYRSTTQGTPGAKVGSSATTTYLDATAVNGSTYYYAITAVNAAGEGTASASSSGATPAVPLAPPAQATAVNVTAGNGQVTVTWTAASGANSYNVYRSAAQGSQGSKIGSATSASFTDLTAVNGATYYYVIAAVNAAGEGPASTQSAAATPSAPVTVPAAPTGVSATRGIVDVTVTWTVVPNATSYNVYRSTTSGTRGSKIGTSATASHADKAVVNGTVYFYSVTAANGAGEGAASAQASVNATTGWANVKFGGGGYVPGLIFHPTARNVLYARTDVAGAYRWDQGNSSWIPITDMFGFTEGRFQGIESIALDPTDANKVYLVGGSYVNGGNARLYKSSDKGATWTPVDLPFPAGGNNAGRAIGERLMVDPHKPSVLFYASRSQGLWRSVDSGATWNQVTGLSSYKMTGADIGSFGNSPIGIEGVVFDTAVPPTGFVSSGTATQTIYVTVAPDYKGLAGLSHYMYKSTDGGTSWSGIAIPSTVLADGALYIPHIVRDVDPNPGTRKIYLDFVGAPGPGAYAEGWAYLYSFDGNSTWTQLKTGPWKGAGLGGLSVTGSGASTVIALGATSTWGLNLPRVYYSTNAGATWVDIAQNKTDWGWIDDVEIDPFDADRVLHVYGGGVWATSNASLGVGSTWSFTVDGLEELATRTLTTPPPGASYLLLAGYWDVGTQVHTNLDTKPTTNMPGNISFGNGNHADMAWTNPAYIAAIGSANGNNPTVGVYSTNSGVSWSAFATMPPFAPAGANVNAGSSGEANIAVTAQGKLVWAPSTHSGNATSNGVPYYTNDNGATWTATNLPPPVQTSIGSAYHLAADRKNPNKVYAYDAGGARWSNTNGKFYYSTDGGKTFTQSVHPTLNGLSFQSFFSTSLAVNPNVEGDVWLTNGDNVFHSTDSGVSWTKLTTMASTPAGYNHYSGPTTFGAQRIALGKPVPGASYSAAVYLVGTVGGVAGVYRSDDAGANWIRINDDAHQWGGVGAIAADNNVAGRVYLAGRGVLYNH